ncbi:MAG TPA: hypothetical protein PKV16_05255 [Caldisericia bacterium]|nr:hypothetical protein [Caldisericia bacterium]HPF48721.1 hypothetical protein [Caldisericia bacterium]HPI83619.1 hypothetical protein [Caldisericia bacterium]HPQ93176.1 hypothetical protein [Caldisericia bacterium]HRV74991.1 hypothetical protein [Caldisericia bacterium]
MKSIPVMITMAIIAAVAIFVILLFLLKFMWGWIVPDLFPGAVSQGLVAAEISWMTAFKVALFGGIFGGLLRGSNVNVKNRD